MAERFLALAVVHPFLASQERSYAHMVRNVEYIKGIGESRVG